MTDDTINLQALVGKSADAAFLREMIGFAAQRLMDLKVGNLTGAEYGEESSDRLAQRNGYRERDWETWTGTVELRISKPRTGSYFPTFLKPRCLSQFASRTNAQINPDVVEKLYTIHKIYGKRNVKYTIAMWL